MLNELKGPRERNGKIQERGRNWRSSPMSEAPVLVVDLEDLESCYRRARNQFHQFVLFDCFSISIFINARPNIASELSLPFSYLTVIDGLVQM